MLHLGMLIFITSSIIHATCVEIGMVTLPLSDSGSPKIASSLFPIQPSLWESG